MQSPVSPIDEALHVVVQQTSGDVAREMTAILADVVANPDFQQADALVLLLRGASSAALDALAHGSGQNAVGPLLRLIAGSWLSLIMLTLVDQDKTKGKDAI